MLLYNFNVGDGWEFYTGIIDFRLIAERRVIDLQLNDRSYWSTLIVICHGRTKRI